MFHPRTSRVKIIADVYPQRITELERIFSRSTALYIDWANVIHWQDTLGWHFQLQRMYQFFTSFDQVKYIRLYTGTLMGNEKSEAQCNEVRHMGYALTTKPVKLMKMGIDVSSIPNHSPDVIKKFIKKSLVRKFDLETISFLNSKLRFLNRQGILYLEEPKCNFDLKKIKEFICWPKELSNYVKSKEKESLL